MEWWKDGVMEEWKYGMMRKEGNREMGNRIIVHCLVVLLLVVMVQSMLEARSGSDKPPGSEDVLEAHQKLLKRYGFAERDKREIYEEEGRRYSYREKERGENEKSKSGRRKISFLDWLRELSLPIVLIIVAILIILFYFMFRGVPGFFRKSTDTSSQQETAGKGLKNRDEEIKTGDRGYHMALDLAKKGEYGKALILLHKASVKKLRENHWIPPGKNFTNNDIRGLIKDTGQGMRIYTPFSQLAAAAERAAFKRENPGEGTYAKLRQMYETTFLKMRARDRY
jgi:uncharacterized membrane protein